MDLITGGLIVGGLWAMLSGGRNGATNGRTITKAKEEGEPDYQPGPIPDVKRLEPLPDVNGNGDKQAEYLAKVDALISTSPKAQRFYQITNSGPNAVDVARTVLIAAGQNSGQNRVRLIKCMTQIPWNGIYVSEHVAKSWGTLYDVQGSNLSAAWLPRHASAKQYLAMHQWPPRTIGSSGQWEGGDATYYALLWIPKLSFMAGDLVCDPLSEGPPKWLTDQLNGGN